MRLWIHLMVTAHYHSRVPPFGYSRIKAYLQLPWTFRSLSRPSSAISALASTLRSCSLDLSISQIVCQFSTTTLLRLLRGDCCSLICVLSSSPSLLTGIFRDLLSDFFAEISFFPVQFSRCVSDLNVTNQLLKRSWWAEVDSNHRPLAYQASALTD